MNFSPACFYLDVHPGCVELAGELHVLVQAGVEVGGDDDGAGEEAEGLGVGQQRGEVDVLQGLGHGQLVLDGAGTRAQVARVLARINDINKGIESSTLLSFV